MKKRLCLLCAVSLFLLALWGCDETVNKNEASKWKPTPEGMNSGCFSNTGYYYAKNGFLYYADGTTGNSVCLCSKVACPHTDDKTCDAAIAVLSYNSMFFWNEGLYYIEQDGFGYHLCRRNADGGALSEVAIFCKEELKNSSKAEVTVDQFVIVGPWMYFTAAVSGVIVGGSDNSFFHMKMMLCRLDLRTGQQEVLLSDEENTMKLIAAQENALLYTREELPETAPGDEGYETEYAQCEIYIMRWDSATGESKALLKKTRAQMSSPRMIDDQIQYNTSQTGSEYRAFDPETGEEKEVAGVTGTILNDQYLFTRPATGGEKTVVDRETGKGLPMEINGGIVIAEAVGEKWFIISVYNSPTHIQYYIVSMAAIDDGIQMKDCILVAE